MTEIGFIGLGIMGKPMAENLLKAGFLLTIYDIDSRPVQELVSLGAIYGTPKEIGEKCGIVFTMLPNGHTVQDILFGSNGLISSIQKGALVCDMSSVTPEQSQIFQQRLKMSDVGFMDAPVSGGEPKAKDGTLVFMAGGIQRDFDRLQPYFEKMGSSALLVGKTGSGSVAKMANQIIVNMTIAAVSEAFVFATKAGADPDKVFRAIRGGLAGSAVLDAKLPMIMGRNFKPGGKLSVNYKDIRNVLDSAQQMDVPTPLTAQLFEIMKALKADGRMEEDHAGIVHYFEQLAGVCVMKAETEGI